jgi:hypothetical protein
VRRHHHGRQQQGEGDLARGGIDPDEPGGGLGETRNEDQRARSQHDEQRVVSPCVEKSHGQMWRHAECEAGHPERHQDQD